MAMAVGDITGTGTAGKNNIKNLYIKKYAV